MADFGQLRDEGRVYWGSTGKQVAYRAFNGQTFYDHQNYLGTERLRTNYAGAVAATEFSLVYGDDLKQTVDLAYADQDNSQYAGQEHDTESGSEHAQFRQYSSTQGRWMSPDPYDGSYSIYNPQSLNRYSYALNSPLSAVDPLGLDDEDDGYGDGGACETDVCFESSSDPTDPGAGGGDPSSDLDGDFDPVPSPDSGPTSPGTGPTPPPPNFYLSVTEFSSCSFCSVTSISNYTAYNISYNFAPNNGPTTSHCIGQALSNGNGTSLALDAAGFIPGEKLLGATAGVVTMVGIGVTSTVNSAINGDLTGSLSGIAGTQLAAIAPAAKYAGISLAESIPGIGTLLNIGVTARDAYHTYQVYQSCIVGH